MNDLLIKCPACSKDMGVDAEKCMSCGTNNPRLVAKKQASQSTIKVILVVTLLFAAGYFFIDYNSTYKKCLREGNKSGLLNPSFVENMCKLASSKK